ncbi:hypothetical protein J7E62_31770 [Variovorax paradoxus]|nr:hypothetical protein [Variovorax paradoxus]
MQMTNWKPIGVVAEGARIDIEGANPWSHRWQRAQEDAVELPHPAYPSQRHRLVVYSIQVGDRAVTFAAGEVSAGVWAFYRPVGQAAR